VAQTKTKDIKFETRNTKSEINTKYKCSKFETAGCFENSNFEFGICFEFRILVFVFYLMIGAATTPTNNESVWAWRLIGGKLTDNFWRSTIWT
jgi:hypothetical protein